MRIYSLDYGEHKAAVVRVVERMTRSTEKGTPLATKAWTRLVVTIGGAEQPPTEPPLEELLNEIHSNAEGFSGKQKWQPTLPGRATMQGDEHLQEYLQMAPEDGGQRLSQRKNQKDMKPHEAEDSALTGEEMYSGYTFGSLMGVALVAFAATQGIGKWLPFTVPFGYEVSMTLPTPTTPTSSLLST